MTAAGLGWLGIVRLGLVQSALGAVVVLTTSTLNRVMVVELALPALVPGCWWPCITHPDAPPALRLWLGRGRTSHALDHRRHGGACGGALLAAVATAWMNENRSGGLALAVAAFSMIGVGVGAAGTSLLVLLAKQVEPGRRAAAATIVWIMMIAGFVVTAGLAGHFLDPYSPARLVMVTGSVALIAFTIALLAVWGVETRGGVAAGADSQVSKPPFRAALAEVWGEPRARRFTIFVFVSMLAFSAQDLILEPFAGLVFGLTPGESTQLSAVQNSGVLVGMILVALVASRRSGRGFGTLRAWTIGGCIASGIALLALAAAGYVGPDWPLRPSVFALGAANGAFSVAAIASMMALVGTGRESREGVRMGLWGAAQAIAFAAGGVVGTAAVDLLRWLIGSPLPAYALVFAVEGLVFIWAARLAARVDDPVGERAETDLLVAPARLAAETSTRYV
jgi:MFS transporter, BCD family, chlorophyll transporter